VAQPATDDNGKSIPGQYAPDKKSGLYRLRRDVLSDNSRIGGVVPLTQIRSDVEVVPAFARSQIPLSELNRYTVMEDSEHFNLNHYCTREVFYRFYDI
jgi:hypothetical protein